MTDFIKLEVVTPAKSIVKEEAEIVMAPGVLGEFGVLKGHTPFLTTLRTGVLHYTDSSGAEKKVFVSGGFAEALPDKVTVLAEIAEKSEDIDLEAAKTDAEQARKTIDSEDVEGPELDAAKAALELAQGKINAVESGE